MSKLQVVSESFLKITRVPTAKLSPPAGKRPWHRVVVITRCGAAAVQFFAWHIAL